MSKSVFAVVVSYNRLATLKETVSSILNQSLPVDKLIVVDNGSTDGSREYLTSLGDPRIELILTTRNLGGAGGFKVGIRQACLASPDWVWIMDDDCIPEKDALEKLVESPAFLPSTGFLHSLVLWKDGSLCNMNIPKPAPDWLSGKLHDLGLFRISSCSFVSTLINVQAVKKVGLPVGEFFIWFDDVEYTTRISQIFPSFLVLKSRVTHHTALNLGVSLSGVKKETLWKYTYGLRNEVSLVFRDGGLGPLRLLILLNDRLRGILFERIPLRLKLKLLGAVLRGLFFNYRKFIEYI